MTNKCMKIKNVKLLSIFVSAVLAIAIAIGVICGVQGFGVFNKSALLKDSNTLTVSLNQHAYLTKMEDVENYCEEAFDGVGVSYVMKGEMSGDESEIVYVFNSEAELKDAKRTLPKALVIGAFAIVAIYVLYYVGLAGAIPNAEMMAGGQAGAKHAFSAVFGNAMGTGIFVFVIISCLGTLNGLMLGCSRGLYSVTSRGRGPAPHIFGHVDIFVYLST